MTSKDTNPKDAIGKAKWRNFFVVPMQVLWEVGIGMLEGTLKYGRHNYRGSGVRASIYVDAAIGHIQTFVEGEDIDRESGLSHITKAICSLIVLRDAMMNDLWVDDRPPKILDLDGLRDHLQMLADENHRRHADKNPHHYTDIEDGTPYGPCREVATEPYDSDPAKWSIGDQPCRVNEAPDRQCGVNGAVDPDFTEVEKLLCDVTWFPGPLRALGRLDPIHIERIPPSAKGYRLLEVMPGYSYTWAELDDLITVEAVLCGLSADDLPTEQLRNALLRRVFIRKGVFA